MVGANRDVIAVVAVDRLLLLRLAKLSTLYEASTQPRRRRLLIVIAGVAMVAY